MIFGITPQINKQAVESPLYLSQNFRICAMVGRSIVIKDIPVVANAIGQVNFMVSGRYITLKNGVFTATSNLMGSTSTNYGAVRYYDSTGRSNVSYYNFTPSAFVLPTITSPVITGTPNSDFVILSQPTSNYKNYDDSTITNYYLINNWAISNISMPSSGFENVSVGIDPNSGNISISGQPTSEGFMAFDISVSSIYGDVATAKATILVSNSDVYFDGIATFGTKNAIITGSGSLGFKTPKTIRTVAIGGGASGASANASTQIAGSGGGSGSINVASNVAVTASDILNVSVGKAGSQITALSNGGNVSTSGKIFLYALPVGQALERGFDATGLPAVVSIDDFVGNPEFDSLPKTGFLSYNIKTGTTTSLKVTVYYIKNGNTVSQSLFTLGGQNLAYTDVVRTLFSYDNDDHDSIFVDCDGDGAISTGNNNYITNQSWFWFNSTSYTQTATQPTSTTIFTYPPGMPTTSYGTGVTFKGTTTTLWLDTTLLKYKINNGAYVNFPEVLSNYFTNNSKVNIPPSNALWTISDSVNQFMLGFWDLNQAIIGTIDLSTKTLVVKQIDLMSKPIGSTTTNTEEDCFGDQLFSIDGRNTWYEDGYYQYNGKYGWKTPQTFDRTTKSTFYAATGGSVTQTGRDVWGSIDSQGYVYFADWGHDNGGMLGVGTDINLGTRKTNIWLASSYVNTALMYDKSYYGTPSYIYSVKNDANIVFADGGMIGRTDALNQGGRGWTVGGIQSNVKGRTGGTGGTGSRNACVGISGSSNITASTGTVLSSMNFTAFKNLTITAGEGGFSPMVSMSSEDGGNTWKPQITNPSFVETSSWGIGGFEFLKNSAATYPYYIMVQKYPNKSTTAATNYRTNHYSWDKNLLLTSIGGVALSSTYSSASPFLTKGNGAVCMLTNSPVTGAMITVSSSGTLSQSALGTLTNCPNFTKIASTSAYSFGIDGTAAGLYYGNFDSTSASTVTKMTLPATMANVVLYSIIQVPSTFSGTAYLMCLGLRTTDNVPVMIFNTPGTTQTVGTNWNLVEMWDGDQSGMYKNLVYSPTLNMIIASDPTKTPIMYLTSTNGTVWQRNTSVSEKFSKIIWAGGTVNRFIATMSVASTSGFTRKKAMWSSDGMSWTYAQDTSFGDSASWDFLTFDDYYNRITALDSQDPTGKSPKAYPGKGWGAGGGGGIYPGATVYSSPGGGGGGIIINGSEPSSYDLEVDTTKDGVSPHGTIGSDGIIYIEWD